MNRPLIIKQLDQNLTKKSRIPEKGWVKTIREAFGMKLNVFAKRLGMNSASASKLEKNEAEDKITLASLKKLADALNCDITYSLVPREGSFRNNIKEQARKYVFSQMNNVDHNMMLENQQMDDADRAEHIKQRSDELTNSVDTKIWTC